MCIRDSPKTVYLRSRLGWAPYVKKNWDPLVLGPELAMDTVPRVLCFKTSLISSLNLEPQMDSPPLPAKKEPVNQST